MQTHFSGTFYIMGMYTEVFFRQVSSGAALYYELNFEVDQSTVQTKMVQHLWRWKLQEEDPGNILLKAYEIQFESLILRKISAHLRTVVPSPGSAA